MELLGLQLDIAWEDREANHSKVRTMLESARPNPGSIVALPELFASGFSMNLDHIADNETRATEQFICETAKQYELHVIGGLATKRPDCRGLNEAVVAGPDGRVVARYAKLHPYAPGKEAQHYAGGEQIVTFEAGDEFKVAPFVCYDLRFPEIFRAAMQRGANVMVVIASWPSPRVEHWITLLRARAIENQCYVMGVNRCGNDPYLPYPGRSLIVDFRGNILADAGEREGIIRAEADPAALSAYRRELPFLADAKTDLSSLFK
jgi:predicted amidohydrolase